MWNSVCDPNSPEFGSSTSSRNIEDVMLARNSSFCEVSGFPPFAFILHLAHFYGQQMVCASFFGIQILGQEQRRWLKKTIMQSNSPLKLVVSSSVVIGNPAKKVT